MNRLVNEHEQMLEQSMPGRNEVQIFGDLFVNGSCRNYRILSCLLEKGKKSRVSKLYFFSKMPTF